MAEKNDDIKQLFSHLGLNPNAYQEIRSAPTASATVSEAPRRWTLLQAAVPARHLTQPITSPIPITAVAAAAIPQDLPVSPGVKALRPRAVEPAPSSLPPLLSAALIQPPPAEGLQSLFQSVREPQAAVPSSQTASAVPLQAERRTDQLLTPPKTASQVERAAALPPPVVSPVEEPETRYAAPPPASHPSRVPTPASALAAQPQSVAAAAIAVAVPGRLKFTAPVADDRRAQGESLPDLFRRLARDNDD